MGKEHDQHINVDTHKDQGGPMTETDYAQEQLNQLEADIRAHIAKHRVPADDSTSRCVDGGYAEDEAVGTLARPGGDLGISMILLRFGFSPQEAFDKVVAFCKENNRKYGWHTDTHEGHDGVVVGCGHCNAAIKAGEKYGVDGAKVQELLDIVRAAQAAGEEPMECVVLNREHSEKAILAVTGTESTLRPWDQEKDEQYFIYDKTRDLALLEQLAEKLGLDVEKVKIAVEEQTNATLGLLGSSKGKPIFAVNVDDVGQIVVEHVGFAPKSA